jgi:beta-lactam-binding protein with PASTA domain
MSLRAYLASKNFWFNLLAAALGTIVLLLVTMYVLRVYTNHGESFGVPDFSGMDLQQVHRQADELDLFYEITDSLYVQDAAPGTVIDQVPVAGFSVKEGRTIFLTICASKPEQVAMPKLTDISYRQALNLMMGSGLNVGNVDYIPSEFPNLVLEQKFNGKLVRAGTPVNKGSNIDLTVGQNRFGEKTEIPNLIGTRLDQANQLLAASYLTTGAIIYDDSFKTSEDSVAARVWKQQPEPEPGIRIEQGKPVDLWLTVDEDILNTANEKLYN